MPLGCSDPEICLLRQPHPGFSPRSPQQPVYREQNLGEAEARGPGDWGELRQGLRGRSLPCPPFLTDTLISEPSWVQTRNEPGPGDARPAFTWPRLLATESTEWGNGVRKQGVAGSPKRPGACFRLWTWIFSLDCSSVSFPFCSADWFQWNLSPGNTPVPCSSLATEVNHRPTGTTDRGLAQPPRPGDPAG